MKKCFNRQMFVLAVFCFSVLAVYADVRLPAIIGDHMVLQQDQPVTIWGWAEPGETVKVKGSWQWFFGESTQADKNGKWQVEIKTPKADDDPKILTIRGNNKIVLKDILIGEVWVCSGQSNMEYSMGRPGDEANLEALREADCPQIRLFDVAHNTALTPREDVEGKWQVCTPQTLRDFSAVGYYFGKDLQEALNVPIGLIGSNWGGTPSEAWTSLETLETVEPFKDTLDMMNDPEKQEAAYQEMLRKWEDRIAEIDKGYQQGWYLPDTDTTDWNEMELPQEWSGTELNDFDGIVWFRREFSLPPSWASQAMELHLGPIDDIDTTWVNGVRIGSTSGWDVPRIYRVPASVLHVGRNVIAVRVIDPGNNGGFRGQPEQMRIGPVGADAKISATVARTWKYKPSYEGRDIPWTPRDISRPDNPNRPAVLYNAMIAPLIPFRIAGAIWYQGESNAGDPILYRTLFPAMIMDWRQQWGQGAFPFYYVQIAPYQYDVTTNSQALREAQLMSLWVPNTGMAVTMDIGEEQDIHPKHKAVVADRLSRWALAKTYGKEDIDFSGPLYQSKKFDGNTIRLAFNYVDGGLVAKDGRLRDFAIAGVDRKFVPAEAVIDGDMIVVSSEQVEHPMAVRYGWSNWVDGSLFNKAGLPASSFRTDDWPLD